MISQFRPEDRVNITRSVMALLHDWGIEPQDQIRLLGLPVDTRPRALARYRSGTAFPDEPELGERIRCLLSMQNSLELTFPHNQSLANFWVTTSNAYFGGRTPLALMLEHGLEGLQHVAEHLDNTQSW